MRTIQTEIIIHAPIERIWSCLIDFPSYSHWNPFITEIKGKPQMNEKLSVKISPPGKKSMIFQPRVTTLSNYELAWLGHLGIPGLVDGNHRFQLLQEGDNKVRFLHSENFSGILHIPIFSLIAESTKAGFEKMNKALKNRCES